MSLSKARRMKRELARKKERPLIRASHDVIERTAKASARMRAELSSYLPPHLKVVCLLIDENGGLASFIDADDPTTKVIPKMRVNDGVDEEVIT